MNIDNSVKFCCQKEVSIVTGMVVSLEGEFIHTYIYTYMYTNTYKEQVYIFDR